MLETGNLIALFHELVRTAMAAQRVESSETTEFYLVQLLEGFARPDRGDLFDPPLGIDFLQAMQLPAAPARRQAAAGRRHRALRVRRLLRQPRTPPGRRRLLRGARPQRPTRHLSSDAGRSALAESFEELAGRFPAVRPRPRRDQRRRSCSAASRTRCASTSAGSTRAASARPTCSCGVG